MALPVYEMVINPEEGSEVEVQMIALVDKPAIEKDFNSLSITRRESFPVRQWSPIL
jgi:hypothetical protein